MEEVKREEYEQLEAQSIPLRNYLLKHVLPTLTEGLNDCCKTRPDDPVDYLVRCYCKLHLDSVSNDFPSMFFFSSLKRWYSP